MRWLALFVLAGGCAAGADIARDGLPLPEWIDMPCGRSMAEVGAQMRVSGVEAACPLSVDRSAGRVSGVCGSITTGIERTVAVEYLVEFDGQTLILGQQIGQTDLRDVDGPEVAVVVAPGINTKDCYARLSPLELDGSLCDEDGDGLENLVEYCRLDREPRIAEEQDP
jgi:hypothetical protein